MNQQPHHWRPRFSIRALLVVMTLFVVFFGYHLNWILQRRAALDGIHIRNDGDPSQEVQRGPGLLFLFAEPGYPDLSVSRLLWSSEQSRERLRSLFTETRFYMLRSDSEMMRDPFEEVWR